MAAQRQTTPDRHRLAPVLGHPGRLRPGTRRLTLLILAFVLVFVLSMAHDEIVAELVAAGWIAPSRAWLGEVAFGLGLFVIWGWLTLMLVKLVKTRTEIEIENGGATDAPRKDAE